jgi:PAS domain-containing protein
MSVEKSKYSEWQTPSHEPRQTRVSELQTWLLALDQKSDILNLLPMAAYVVRAPDGVVIWYNRRAAELWGRKPAGDTDERFCGAHTLYRAG